MKFYNTKPMHYLALLSLLFLISCGGGGGGNTAPTAPAIQQIWKNGTSGTWFGSALTPTPTVPANLAISNVAVTDNISGDVTTLRLSTPSSFNGTVTNNDMAMYFICSVAQNASNYYSSGHLQFNIRLEKAFSVGDTLAVSYGDYLAQHTGSYTISLNTLSNSTFTHISIPISLFNQNYSSLVNTPFRIQIFHQSQSYAASEAIATLSDIKWTEN